MTGGLPRGIVGIDLAPGAVADAPGSGVRIGTGPDGPLSIRLARIGGTRILVAGRVLPAQLLAVRAAAAGLPVTVATGRGQLWEPLLRGLSGCRVRVDASSLDPTGGAEVLVDDRPPEARTAGETRPWTCRVDLRSQWTPAELAGFARYDLAVFGAVPPEATRGLASAFGLPRGAADQASRLDASSFAVLRRGAVHYVSLDPTSAEAQLLEQARGFGSVGARGLPAGR